MIRQSPAMLVGKFAQFKVYSLNATQLPTCEFLVSCSSTVYGLGSKVLGHGQENAHNLCRITICHAQTRLHLILIYLWLKEDPQMGKPFLKTSHSASGSCNLPRRCP